MFIILLVTMIIPFKAFIIISKRIFQMKNMPLKLENSCVGYQLEVISSLEPLTIEDYENVCANLCDRTNNTIGRTLSALWSLFQGLKFSKPSLEKIELITKSPEERKGNIDRVHKASLSSSVKKLFFDVQEDEYFIFGHTHKLFLENNSKVANSGSWVKDAERHNTYIKIKNQQVKLKDYQWICEI